MADDLRRRLADYSGIDRAYTMTPKQPRSALVPTGGLPLDVDRASAVVAAALIFSVTMTLPCVMPALFGVFGDRLHLGGRSLGFIGAMYTLGLGIAAASSFLWIRQFNWRICMTIGMVELGVATALEARCNSFPGLVALMLVAGAGSGIAASPALTALGDGHNPQRNLGVMIFLSVILPAIVIAGIAPTSAVLGDTSACLLISVLAFVALPLILLIPRGGHSRRSTVTSGRTLQSRSAWLASASMFLFVSGYIAVWDFFERIGIRAGLHQGPILNVLAVSGLIGGSGGFVASLVTRKITISGSFFVVNVATMVTLLSLAIFPLSLLNYFLAASSFQILTNANFSNIMSTIAITDERGRLVAMIPAIQCFGASVGSITAGIAFQASGRTGVISVSAGAFVVCAVLMAWAFRSSHGVSSPAARWRCTAPSGEKSCTKDLVG